MVRYSFDKDIYITPNDTPVILLDKLLLRTRWAFYIKYMQIVLRCSKAAKEGRYSTRDWYESSQDIFSLIESVGGRFHLTGLDNLRKIDKPVVFVSNHMSTLETMILPGIISPFMELTFVVKDSLIKGDLFGPIMRSRRPVVVGRTNSMADFKTVMEQGQARLAEGASIVIFPQSTRAVKFDPKEFNTMGVKLASAAGTQVVPVAIKTDFWGNGKHVKELGPINRSKTIYMDFGAPITLTNGRKEHAEIVEFISSRLSKWNTN